MTYNPKSEAEAELPKRLARGAICGSFACGGCYDVDGKQFHPPRPGYCQTDLIELDGGSDDR